MKIITLPRGGGKTMACIKTAYETGGYIVCNSRAESERVFKMATDAKIRIAFPITLNEFLLGEFGEFIPCFIIDNVDDMLRVIARGIKIHTVTLTPED